MDPLKKKDGLSIREIEEFTKKHRFELFFCLYFIFACFFSFVFFGPGWAVVFAGAGGIFGTIYHTKVEFISKKILHYVFKQEEMTQMVLAIVGIIISLFLPPVIFMILGLHGGKDLHHMAAEIYSQHKNIP